MPTYQYACTECGHDFETVQSFSDDALTECPECQGRLRKKFGAVGIVFKGAGFYRNDSREATSSKVDAGTKTDAKSDGAKSDGAKSDGAKSDGAKSDGASSTPAKTGSSSGSKPSSPAASNGSGSSSNGSSGSGKSSSTAGSAA